MTRIYGALPPSGVEWQMGKTTASIDFVNKVRRFIQENPNHKNIESLTMIVQQVIDGTVIFNKPVNLEPYLKDPPRGGLPPYEPWHTGKTPQSIDLADAASRFIQQHPNHDGREILQKAIDDIKSGKLVISEWTSPEVYIKEVQALGD